MGFLMEALRKRLQYAPVAVLAALAIALLFLLYFAFRGKLSTGLANAAASLILVIVTIYYAYQAKQNADFMEESVKQMEKDRAKRGHVLAIAFGIDEILDKLEKNANRGDVDSPNRPPLPKFGHYTGSRRDGPVERDIRKAYKGFPDEIERHRAKLRKYSRERGELKERMRDEIYSRAGDEFVELLGQRGESTDRELAKNIAEWTLRGHRDSVSDADEAAQTVYQLGLEVRKEEQDTVEELRSLREQVRESRENLVEELQAVRSDWRQEYGISEFEIKKAKKEHDLGPIEVGRPQI